VRLAQVAFLPHPNFGQHMRRRRVVRHALRPDTIHAQRSDAKADDGAGGFGRVTLPSVFRREFVTDVGLARVGRFLADAAVADVLSAFLEGDRQLKLGARLRGLRA